MLSELKSEIARRVAARVRDLYGVDHQPQVEIPPRRALGDLSLPAALQLARVAKKNPRLIAQEISEGLELPEGVRELKIEGAGYLNLYLDRSWAAGRLLRDGIRLGEADPAADKIIIEHTNINPNKAAHIGHLRNAVLGDVLARSFRALARPVEVQNYIDDTGVQVADVVVGFIDLEGKTLEEVAALPEPFDYLCWDLYSSVGQWYEEGGEERKALRRETLHALESGEGPRAEMGRLVARRIVTRHLATMARLGIGYDLLTHESSILGLDFFSQAFEKLKERGAVRLETEGKNEGCWVMPLSETPEFAGLEDPDKVIVRSDGTVTYVGKDIAYQLWKFGLLGRDFQYRFWEEEKLWKTALEGVEDHPDFGGGSLVINVIDARQSYLQKIVKAGLEALGHEEAAERSIHFAYEMVALSPGTAAQLGYADDGEGGKTLEMSGRKGIGVKADDLLDQLTAKAREEIASRNRDLPEEELAPLSKQIAVAALRYFMVKANTHRVIAFDLDEALSFEGDSGPYLQYSLVRSRNIRRRLEEAGLPAAVSPEAAEDLAAELWSDDLWDLAHFVSQIPEVVAKAGETLELSMLARHAWDLGQKFNAAYHKHPILQEEDEALRTCRLAAVQIFADGLETLTELLGVPVPERM